MEIKHTKENERMWKRKNYNKSKKSSLSGSFTVSQAEYIDSGATSLDTWSFWIDYHEGYKIPWSKEFNILVDSAGTTDETCVRFNADVNPESSFRTQSDTELEYYRGFDETVNAIKENIGIVNQEDFIQFIGHVS